MANKAFRDQARRFCQWRYYRMKRRAKLSEWLEDQTEHVSRRSREVFAKTRMAVGVPDEHKWGRRT